MTAALLTLTILLLSAGCHEIRPARILIETSLGTMDYRVEVADSALSRVQGLMNREPLPHNTGMLFLYSRETTVSFWMKDVSFPLDIIFFNKAGSVVKIHKNALPYDLTPIQSEVPIIAVLELRGGTAKQDKIAIHDMADFSRLMITR